jgi:hypothetical protein
MRVKINGGTAAAGEGPLCPTCRHATIVRGTAANDLIVECDRLAYGHGRIPFPVTSCSVYSDRRRPALREMEDIAWVLRSDPRRREIGFVRSADLKPRERWVLADEDD